MQIGNSIKLFALNLSLHHLPKDRLSQIMKDLLNIEISDTTLLKFETQLGEKLENFRKDAEAFLKNCPVKHADETGLRVEGKTQWGHVLCNEEASVFRLEKGRKNSYLDGRCCMS